MFNDSFQRMALAVDGLRRMHRSSRTMAALSQLDDHLLYDIGIARSDIPGVAIRLTSGPGHRPRHDA